jgi:glycosyltransferase involved in cell wall biosynthesis
MNGANILFIVRQAEFGGGETHIKYIFESINRDFFRPILVSLSEGYLSDFASSLGIKFYLLSNKRLSFISNIIKLIRIIKKEKINFIHAHGTKGASLILFPSLITGKKFIYTVHGWSFHTELTKFQIKFRKIIEQLICRYAHLVIFVSESDFQRGDFIKTTKKILIKNGIDISRFAPFRNAILRKELGYTHNDFVIGFFTRFTHQKNPLFAIELINALKDEKIKDRRFKLLMIGDGELKEQILDEIRTKNLEDLVKVLEPSFEIEKYLNIMDCYILPSFWEGLPYGVLEAMSSGVPVIASKIPNICEVIEHSQNGFCEELKIDDFKSRILMLANDSNLNYKISINARKTIENKFNIENSLIEIFKVYEKFKIYDRS